MALRNKLLDVFRLEKLKSRHSHDKSAFTGNNYQYREGIGRIKKKTISIWRFWEDSTLG